MHLCAPCENVSHAGFEYHCLAINIQMNNSFISVLIISMCCPLNSVLVIPFNLVNTAV